MTFPKSFNYVYIVVLSGNFLALTGDSALSWPSPVLPKLASNDTDINPLGYPITDDQNSWIGSVSNIGAMVGVLPSTFLSDWIGRKPTLLIIAVPHIIAFLMLAFAEVIELYYVARFLNGLSVSACYVVLPLYVAEISEDSNRGLMLVSFHIFSSLGGLFSNAVGAYVSLYWYNIVLSIFPSIFFISFLLLAPESPYYYVIRKDYNRALDVLNKLRSNDYRKAELELENIKNETIKSEKGNILGTLRTKYALKGCLIVIVLTSFQQLSGYAAYLPYSQTIFNNAGGNFSAAVSSIIVGGVSFITSFFCPFLVDSKGRKFLLVISLIGIIISEVTFGTYYYLLDRGDNVASLTWLPVVCLVIFMFTFALGLGPVPLTIAPELLPVNIKFIMSTVAGLLGSLSSFVVSKNFNNLNDNLGRAGTIWLFSGICLSLLLFIIFYVPETKGKSLRKIQEILEK